MTMRTPPYWFQNNRYEYLKTCNPTQWYQELSSRREMKALYELRKSEAEIFIDDKQSSNPSLSYEYFFKSLEDLRAQNLTISDPVYIKKMPMNIRRYIDFNIVPLFDLLHWYELSNEPTPSHEELKYWLFPDTERRVRYIVGDAKKMLKVALLECDAFKRLILK